MRKTTVVSGIVFLAMANTLVGCADKSNAGNTPPVAPPEQAMKAANSAPPEVKTQVDRGVAQGQADGKAYAERMSAGATPPK